MRAFSTKLMTLMAVLALAGCSIISPSGQTPVPTLESTTTPLVLPTEPAPAATQTSIIIVVTATPEAQPSPTLESTPVVVQPTATAAPADESGAYPVPVDAPIYVPQTGTPARVQNFARPDEGCNLTAVAGQVFDAAGNPQLNLVVQVGGTLSNRPVNALSLTGAAPAYGPGGYEVLLASEALESAQTLWLQLIDLQGKPISAPIPFDTEDDCLRNVVLINFVPAG